MNARNSNVSDSASYTSQLSCGIGGSCVVKATGISCGRGVFAICCCHSSTARRRGLFLGANCTWRTEPRCFRQVKVGRINKRLYFDLSSFPRKHPYYLNGRLLFLIVTQITAALAYCLRIVMLDRFAFCWPLAAVCL